MGRISRSRFFKVSWYDISPKYDKQTDKGWHNYIGTSLLKMC